MRNSGAWHAAKDGEIQAGEFNFTATKLTGGGDAILPGDDSGGTENVFTFGEIANTGATTAGDGSDDASSLAA